ncbi:MAG: SDR family oxidoreductase [Vicingaceae bacterium]
MRILVTGSNGLLGQKLVHQLKNDQRFELLATSRGKNRISDESRYKYQALDISRKEEVLNAFNSFQPDVVINTAAMTNVDACESDKEGSWELNVEAVKHLIEASEKHDTHLIHLSTDFVFDGEDGPYKEEDRPNPLSYYGRTKWEAEKLIQSSNVKWTIIRTIIVYGIVEDMSRSNIVLWAKSALEKKQKLTIVNDQFRSPTLVEDLAAACVSAAAKSATGIYHISGKDFMSIVQLVKRVAAYYDLDDSYVEEISSESLNQAAKRPPKTGFILDKAYRELDYQPHSFEEGIAILEQQLKT